VLFQPEPPPRAAVPPFPGDAAERRDVLTQPVHEVVALDEEAGRPRLNVEIPGVWHVRLVVPAQSVKVMKDELPLLQPRPVIALADSDARLHGVSGHGGRTCDDRFQPRLFAGRGGHLARVRRSRTVGCAVATWALHSPRTPGRGQGQILIASSSRRGSSARSPAQVAKVRRRLATSCATSGSFLQTGSRLIMLELAATVLALPSGGDPQPRQGPSYVICPRQA